MPRKKKIDYKPASLVNDPLPGLAAGPEFETDPDDDELDDVFGEFPQNEACIELFRTSQQGGRPVFLENIMPSVFSFGYVTEHYGGGRYIARGKYKDGTIQRRGFEIEGDPFPVKRKAPNRDVYAPVSTAEFDQNRRPPMLEPVTAAEVGGNELAAAMMTMMKTMMLEMRSSETEFLSKMKLYKDIFGQGERKEAPLDQALSMLKQGIELGQINSGEGGGSSIWLMALDKLKEPLTKIVDTIQVAVTQNKRTLPNVPIEPVKEGLPTPAPEPKKEESMILGAISSLLPVLLNGAAKGSDPDLYVDFLLDQLPRPFYNQALSWLMEPDCLEQLAQKEPGIRYQQEWWSALRSGLVSALNEELGHVESVQPEPARDPATNGSADL
jgi:hypothetical protein